MVAQLNHNTNLNNVEAETLILGGILFNPKAIAKVAEILTPENFYVPSHQKIYQTCLELYREGSPTDLMLTMARLEEKGEIEKVGGLSYLATLIERTATSANIDRYAGIVLQHAEKREIQSLLVTIDQMVKDRNYSAFELQEKLIEKATSLKSTVIRRSPVKLAIAQIKQILQRKDLTEFDQKIKLEELRQEFGIHPIPWNNDYLLPSKQELINSKVIDFPSESFDVIPLIDDIIKKDLPESQLQIALNSTARISGYRYSDLKKIYDNRYREKESDLEAKELTETLPDLIKKRKAKLNILEVLPPKLANLLIEIALAMPTAPEAIFTHLIPTWGSAVGTSSRIVVKASAKYVQPCIFRTMVVANSGDRKSPALDIATEALEELEDEAHEIYEAQLDQYNDEIEEWGNLKKEERGIKPQPPVQSRYITMDTNFEGTIKVHKENPRGLLNKVDELAGYFKRMNKFRNGHGDDDTNDLSLFSGRMYKKDRKSESVHLKRTAISATGTIQWDTLRDIQGKAKDTDYTGMLARWLVCATELPTPYLDLFNDPQTEGFSLMNRKLIEWLRDLPERDYFLSLEAKAIFQDWQHSLIRRMKKETITSMEVAYPKFETYCVRLALLLHLIWAWETGTLETLISGETVLTAIHCVEWYINQLRFVLAKNCPALSMEGHALAVRELLQKKGTLTLRETRRGKYQLKDLTDEQLKSIFRAIVESGFAEYEPSKTLRIKSVETTIEENSIPDFYEFYSLEHLEPLERPNPVESVESFASLPELTVDSDELTVNSHQTLDISDQTEDSPPLEPPLETPLEENLETKVSDEEAKTETEKTVRYKGEIYRIAYSNNSTVGLRKAGFKRVLHRVRWSDVEII